MLIKHENFGVDWMMLSQVTTSLCFMFGIKLVSTPHQERSMKTQKALQLNITKVFRCHIFLDEIRFGTAFVKLKSPTNSMR